MERLENYPQLTMARKLERMDAKRFYCEDGIEIAEIAKRLNVPESTVYRWKAEDKEKGSDWDNERASIRMTSFSAYKQALKIAIDKLNSIAASGKVDVKEADAIVKIIKSAKSLHKDVDTLGNILLAMTEFTEFLAEKSPEMLDKLSPYLSEFGNEMSKKHGKNQ